MMALDLSYLDSGFHFDLVLVLPLIALVAVFAWPAIRRHFDKLAEQEYDADVVLDDGTRLDFKVYDQEQEMADQVNAYRQLLCPVMIGQPWYEVYDQEREGVN